MTEGENSLAVAVLSSRSTSSWNPKTMISGDPLLCKRSRMKVASDSE